MKESNNGNIPFDIKNEETRKFIQDTSVFFQNVETGHSKLKERMKELDSRLIQDGFDEKRRREIFDTCFKPYAKKAWYYRCLPQEVKRHYEKKSTVDFNKVVARLKTIQFEQFKDQELEELYRKLDSMKGKIEEVLQSRHKGESLTVSAASSESEAFTEDEKQLLAIVERELLQAGVLTS